MNASALNIAVQVEMLAQPSDVRGLTAARQDQLLISARKVGSVWIVVSRYGDDTWWLTGTPTNVAKGATRLQFLQVPPAFQAIAKQMLYQLKARGRTGSIPMGPRSLIDALKCMRLFFQYAADLGLGSISEVNALVCASYAQACRDMRPTVSGGRSPESAGKPLAPSWLYRRLVAVEMIYELSQHTDWPMRQHPWPDSSADHISRYGKQRLQDGNTTPLMSDEVFCALFKRASAIVESAGSVLDVRDQMDSIAASNVGYSDGHVNDLKRRAMVGMGWEGGGPALAVRLIEIRTACYVVVASLSGCRNHELGHLRRGSYYSTEDDNGERYSWMRSISTKTDEGATEWMIPEAAVQALRVMDRWAAPYQDMLRNQIKAYRNIDVGDIRIAEAEQHLDAIFVGIDKTKENQVRTISLTQFNKHLKAFVAACGLKWQLSTHQFRRKFANYAAHSRFGDLRYLRKHFKHWSMDMTVGYALNGAQEMALYLEIDEELGEIKQRVVAGWLDSDKPLAGGYGSNIVDWRDSAESVTLFKTRAHMVRSIAESTAIRSNGHAWCTADDNLCDGNDVNPTRCGGCSSAVVGLEHSPIYQGLYRELRVLKELDDIGEGGLARVQRDLDRCRSVLTALGNHPLEAKA